AKLVVDVEQASNVIAIIVADCKDGIKRIPLLPPTIAQAVAAVSDSISPNIADDSHCPSNHRRQPLTRLPPPPAQPLSRLCPPISEYEIIWYEKQFGYDIRNNPYRYEGGETKIYEDNNSDEMSLVEIWNKAKIFGYGENDIFMYRVPTMPFAGGLKPLENDVDVMNMVKCIKGETKIYEDNNSDEMSLVEIWNKAKIFGYGENDIFMYRVPTMPFAGGLKPLENDVDVMNMVKCIKGYNEVEVYVMFLDDYENAIGNEGDGEDGDNEGGNLDEGDKVDGVVSEEDSVHKVHFGCSESDDDDMFAQYISSGEIASKVKLKEGRKGKAIACGVSPSRVGGSGFDPSGVGQSEVGASGVSPSGIDARGVDPTKVDVSGVNPSASALVAFGADRDEDKWESETSASLVSSSDDETRPRYPQYHPPESFSEVHFELEMQFATKRDVMDAIKLYSIFKGVPIKVRVRVKCTDKCPFELYYGKMKDEDTWIVKKLNPEHNCGRRFKNRFASSNWLGKHLVDDVRSDPNVRESNVIAHSLENQEHGTSSSHVEPTNRAAPPPQTSKEAYVSQHNQKIPVRKRNVTTQSQPTPQCEGVHQSQPASQVGPNEVTRNYSFGVSVETMAAASETSRRITKFYKNAQGQNLRITTIWNNLKYRKPNRMH
ncbi:hypothetical protein CFP56_007027, partial [Quercus suber]